MNRGSICIDRQGMRRGFVRLPLEALHDPLLSARALRALGILLHYEFRGRGYPGHERVALDFGWARSSYLRALGELERAGWLRRGGAELGATASLQVALPDRLALRPEDPKTETASSQEWNGERPKTETTSSQEGDGGRPRSETPGVPDLGRPLKTVQELVKEDPEYRLLYEAIRDTGTYFGRHPEDREAQQALRAICAARSSEEQRAAIAAHQATLARVRRELQQERAQGLAPAPPRVR